jgi:NAD(P)-dependent dehydrogenase (short-subunit alcohol dehydrogenase family)
MQPARAGSQLTKALANEWMPGVNVNAIAPA